VTEPHARGGGSRFRHRRPHNVLRPGGVAAQGSPAGFGTDEAGRVPPSPLTKLGRSAALLLGTSDPARRDLLLTITAATPRRCSSGFTKSHPLKHCGRRSTPEFRQTAISPMFTQRALQAPPDIPLREQIRAELARAGTRA